MRIALAASGRLGMSLFEGLRGSGHQVVLCVLDGRQARGWRRRAQWLSARLPGGDAAPLGRALRRGIPVLWLDTQSEAEIAPLRRLQVDVLLVGGFGIILKEPLLSAPRVGCVNTHSSLLPLHRGPNPFAAAVLAGDTESGVTFHRIDAGIDTGPILDQAAFPIGRHDTAAVVYRKACALAKTRVVRVMDRVSREGLAGTPQPEGAGTYDRRITLEDARLDFSDTAEALYRRVRGLAGARPAWFKHRGRRVEVLRAQFDPDPVDAPPGTVIARRPWLTVATGQGTLQIRAAVLAGRLPLPWPLPWARPRVGDALGEDTRPSRRG